MFAFSISLVWFGLIFSLQNMQGDIGFQGQPGPPGPRGVGELGPPVSEMGFFCDDLLLTTHSILTMSTAF